MSKVFIADKQTLDDCKALIEACNVSINKCYSFLNDDEDGGAYYGFIEHMDVLSPTSRIEYIGKNIDFTPISLNKATGVMNLNSWADFPIITENKPYMVHSDGTIDYELCATDYTKKVDGVTASDVSSTAYGGGAFSWIKKVYKKEIIQGNNRIVRFSFEKLYGYEPVGFVDPDGKELEGVWLPMFYGSIHNTKMRSLSGLQPCYGKTTAEEYAAITAFSSRGAFLGGGIVNTIVDLLIMFAKSTNTQEAYGYGNCNGYNSSGSPTYGVKSNAVIKGGQFYGTEKKTELNKIFHSIVLGSWQQWMRDPYTLLVNGSYKISKNYLYDPTGVNYVNTGITIPATVSAVYPDRYEVVEGFGAVPIFPYNGSSATGGCDGFWSKIDITAVARRFGNCTYDLLAGARALALNFPASYAYWDVGAAVLLLPPVGVAA